MQEKENYFNLISVRSSIRAFQKREIEAEKVETILDAVIKAPSAGNMQSYRMYDVTGLKMKYDLAKAAYGQIFISEASLCLVFCADKERARSRYGARGEQLYAVQDATIAAAFAMLAAEALGLSSCWVGAFDTDAVSQVLKVDDGLVPVAILPIGYPAESPPKTGRRNINEILVKIK